METRHLQAFLAVAEELHFGRAAIRLRLSPAPVSRTVAQLERELGVRLFERSHHQVTLTDAGAALLPQARELASSWAAFSARGRALAGVSAPVHVRVGSPSTAPSESAEAIAALLAEVCPGAVVEVEFDGTVQLLDSLRRRELDVTVAHLPLEEDDLQVLTIARYPLGVVVPDQHELAGRPELIAEDLRGLRFLMVGARSQAMTVRRSVQWLLDAGASVEQQPDADVVRIAQLVRHGRGVTLSLLAGPVAHVFNQQGLRTVPLREPVADGQLGLVLRTGDDRTAWMDVLVERVQLLTDHGRRPLVAGGASATDGIPA